MAERPGSRSLRYLESARLRLVAANMELVRADLAGRDQLADLLAINVPDNWPPDLYDGPAMHFALRQLNDPAEQGWSFWYLQTKQADYEQLAGLCGFKGRPDGQGSVEIGYSVLEQFRGQGFAVEAVQTLVSWAFAHPGVREVSAETLPYLKQSIRVLEKCGFKHTGPGSEYGVVRYAIQRSVLR